MPAHTRVDTESVRTLARAYTAQREELTAVAAALAAVPLRAADSALGAVGARFLAALSDAVAAQARDAAALAERVGGGAVTAGRSAAAYDAAAERAAALLRV